MSLEIVLISKEVIENGNVNSVLEKLKRLTFDKNTARKYRDGLRISIYGYEDNPKPLFQIKEVQDFMKNLDKEFPYWFYFLSKSDNSLEEIMFYVCPSFQLSENRKYRVQYQIFNNFMFEHFKALQEMFELAEISEEERSLLKYEIATYFFNVNDRYYHPDEIEES